MEEAIAIIGFFGVIPLTVWIVSKYRARSHANTMEIIEKLVERGDVINEETVKSLGIQKAPPHKDLKTGLILIAIALGLVLLMGSIPEEDEGKQVLIGFASFPFLIGLVYVFFWSAFGRKQQ